MAEWQGQSRGTPLGYKIFLFLLNRVGVRAAYLLLIPVSLYYVFFVPKATKAIYYYFHNRLNYSPIRAILRTRLNFYVFGQTIVDKFAIMGGMKSAYSYEFDGEEHLVDMANNTGGILIGAHLGNWDIASQLLNRLSKPFNIVMYENELESMKKLFDQALKEKKIKIIAIKQDLSHVFEIKKAFDNKELICFHGDRFLDGSKFIETEFLGEKAKFPHGPFYLASKFKMPYTFVYAMKEPALHYHLYATKGIVHEGSVEELVANYVVQLEQKVKQYPLQWFNYYQFWNH
jgi:predicted LPLAT superfamily acyltransferase